MPDQSPLDPSQHLSQRLDVDFALQAAGLGVWEYDPASGLVNWDDRCRTLYGLAKSDRLPYEQAISFIHPDDAARVDQAVQRAMSPHSDGRYEATYRTIGADDGLLRWVRFVGRSYFGLTGEVYRFAGVAHEITEQVVARQKIEESEARFQALIEEAPVATCLFVGRELRIEIANEAMIRVWGKGVGVLGLPLADALPELRDQHFLTTLDEVFTTGIPFSTKAGRADLVNQGRLQTFYFNYDFKALRNTEGEIYAIMEMAVDVTEQVMGHQQLQASEARYRQLAQSLEVKVQERTEELAATNEELEVTVEEVAASNEEYMSINDELLKTNDELNELTSLLTRSNENLQQFAYVASHDLQEPLRKIQSFGQLLKDQYGDLLGQGGDYIQRMQVSAERMSSLIRDLLNYSRISTQRDTSKVISLTKVVNMALSDLELTIEQTGAIVSVQHLPDVFGDVFQLGQLFQNLLSNALKFRKEGVVPRIEIRSGLITPAHLPSGINPGRGALIYQRIDVVDNGIGFEQKYADRIFQVFQRLHGKSSYAGTGIGLAICEKVVANHGGAITATSQPGQGATFSVYLPI